MPISRQYSVKEHILRTRFDGTVDTREIREHFDAIAESSRREPLRGDIVDLTAITRLEADIAEITEATHALVRDLIAPADFRLALITSTPFSFGVARQIQAICELDTSIQAWIFEDPREAEAWVCRR